MSPAYNEEGKVALNKVLIIKKIATSLQRTSKEPWVPLRHWSENQEESAGNEHSRQREQHVPRLDLSMTQGFRGLLRSQSRESKKGRSGDEAAGEGTRTSEGAKALP